MPRHKHQPKGIVTLGDTIIEVCVICKRRRSVIVGTGWVTKTHYSKWFTREEANKDMYGWLWTGTT